MLITHTRRAPSIKVPLESASKKETEAKSDFTPGVAPYNGPADGKSTPRKHTKVLTSVATALLAPGFTLDIQGEENLHTEGTHVYTFNHPSVLDPPVALMLLKGDVRTVANEKLFKNSTMAKVLEWSGCYPINRDDPSPVTKSHPIDLLQSGTSVAVFAEGGNSRESIEGRIGPFKKGPAYSAIHGGADSVIPASFYFKPAQTETSDWVRAGLTGAVGAALGAGGALIGGPVGTVCRIAAGAVAGAALGGGLGSKLMPQKKWYDPTPPLLGKIAGGALGALAGGVAAGLTGDSCSPFLTGAVSGVGAFGLTRGLQNRTTIQLKVGEPVDVAPYRGQDDSVTKLTIDLHRNIGGMTSELSGVPYDDTAKKIHAKGDYSKV